MCLLNTMCLGVELTNFTINTWFCLICNWNVVKANKGQAESDFNANKLFQMPNEKQGVVLECFNKSFPVQM